MTAIKKTILAELFRDPAVQTSQGPREATEIVQLAPAPFVTVRLASTLIGLSDAAIRGKIREGKWLDGREYVRAPDGGIFISLKGVERWVCAGSK
jgi:hypothetical protein